MLELTVPNSVSFHTANAFFSQNPFFEEAGGLARVTLHPRWMHIEPFGMAMLAAWGAWCRRHGVRVEVENLGPKADYAWRMHLFQFLGVEYQPQRVEREEAGRFLPVTQVRNGADIRAVIGDISALLHLQHNPESLAAVQYCVSELLRNVIEHSNSSDGAFICAHNYDRADPARVTIAVADCGVGIRAHLGRAYPEAQVNDWNAVTMAMRPGITGAIPGMYGTPDNAGAGLFITRSIAKGSGGYFLVASGEACYRLRRAKGPEAQTELPLDPTFDRHDKWVFPHPWQGTVVSMEIRTDQIDDFDSYFAWIRKFVPAREEVTRRIRFT